MLDKNKTDLTHLAELDCNGNWVRFLRGNDGDLHIVMATADEMTPERYKGIMHSVRVGVGNSGGLELNVLADKDYQFPQLDKEQSRILWGFLSDIHEETRPPYAMFELISGLMFSDSFEKTMVLAKNWNILEIKTSQNS